VASAEHAQAACVSELREGCVSVSCKEGCSGMSNVEIRHDGTETTVENPEFIDVLLNVNEVSVDGRVFTDVEKVSYHD